MSDFIKPMLAHKYKPQKVTFPCHVQPKLNGVRGIYVPGRHFQSRYGEIWNPPVVAHLLSALTSRCKFHLDGEMYCHGMPLQQINSRIGVVRHAAHLESEKIQYHVFDVLTDSPFYIRLAVMQKLATIFRDFPQIQFVETQEVVSDLEADYWYTQWKQHQGYEGMMYRESDATYGFEARCGNKENRWNCLLKRKEMIDLEATITGFKQMMDADGELKDTLGAFELITEEGIAFSAGSGLTNEDRDKYWRLGPEVMRGVKVRVLYEMRSDGNVPLKPIIDLVDSML